MARTINCNPARGCISFICLWGLIWSPGICQSPENGQAPNILFIMADDLGYGDLGCYGQKVIQTPHIDQLASDGMRFTRCYAGSPVCAPSRSVLMTGLHTGHTTIRGNTGLGGVVGLGGKQGRVPLDAEDMTVADELKKLGYVTGCIGKWGLGEPNTTGEPRKQGFDYFFGYLNQRRAHNYFPEYLWENETKFALLGNQSGEEHIYSHDLFTKKAIQFLEENVDTSFFLYLPYTVPHDEYEIPETTPYQSMPWTDEEKVHAAMISRLDRDIGTLLNLLEDLHLTDRTVIFFCSDNGAARRWEGRFESSGTLRGRKRDLYEGGIRTPMIIKYPGALVAGSVNRTPWYFADVLPTLVSAAGGQLMRQVDGINLWSHITLGSAVNKRVLYWEFHERDFQQAVQKGDWKLVALGGDADLQLFNIRNDPAESRNLSSDLPSKVKELVKYLNSERTASENWPIEKNNQKE